MTQLETSASDEEGATRWAPLMGVTAALAMFGAAQGLSYPLFTLLMQRQGMSAGLIGISAAMMPLGLILSASLVPWAVRRFGARNLAVACALIGAACFFLIGWLQNWIGWFAIRFLLGFVINPLYVLGEVWALALSPPAKRGRVMGVFNAVMGAGYAVGPLSLTLVGIEGWPPFLIAVGGFLACGAILHVVASGLAGFERGSEQSNNVLGFAKTAPALLAAVLSASAVQQSTYSLTPVFGAAHGLPEAILASLITALSLGNIVLQIPLGLAAERFNGRAMMLFCAVTTAACAMLLPVLILTPLVWPLLVVMGGVGYGVYTMALVELGNRFKGQTLVTGNAAFALMWGAGGIAGPSTSGALMQAVGPLALPAVIAGLSLLLSTFVIYRSATRRRS